MSKQDRKGNDSFSHWNLELVWILRFEIWTLEFVRDTPLWLRLRRVRYTFTELTDIYFDGIGLAALAKDADLNDLSHDRRNRSKLGLDPLRQAVAGERQLLGHDLAINVDVGVPPEFDIDHGQSHAGRAADLLHAARTTHDRF
jgi:hypothetical protein